MKRLALLFALAALPAAAQESLFLDATPARARDPLLDHADLVGRVCDDVDGDGRCTGADDPVEGATIALETGFATTTAADGSYHLRDVAPGQVLVKLDMSQLPAGSTAVSGDRQIVELPRAGLVAQDFPLHLARDRAKIGRAEKYGYKLFPTLTELPVSVVGNVNDLKALANGVQVKVPDAEAELPGLVQGSFARPGAKLAFQLHASYALGQPAKWQLDVIDQTRIPVKTAGSSGAPPRSLAWDVASNAGKPLGEGTYSFRLCVTFQDGEVACSPFRAFGVMGPGGQRPKVDRPSVQPRAALNGQTAPLDHDGSFLRNVAPNAGRRVKLELTKADGRSATATIKLPQLALAAPAQPVGIEWGTSNPDVTAPATQDRITVHLRGRTAPGNRVSVSDKRTPVGADGGFARDLVANKGKTRYEATVSGPGGFNSIYEVSFWLADKDPAGRPIIAVERIPDMEVEVPAEGSAIGLATLTVRGRTAPGNTVTIDGKPAPLDAGGAFRERVRLARGASRLVVEVVDPQGHRGEVSRALDSTGAGALPAALADASPGGAFTRDSGGKAATLGLVAGGAQGAWYKPGAARIHVAAGAVPTGPETLNVPVNAGFEYAFAGGVVGLHVLGGYFQDFIPADVAGNPARHADHVDAALTAQKGYVAAPTLAGAFDAGRARVYVDASYRTVSAGAVDPRSLAGAGLAATALDESGAWWQGGAGVSYPLSSALELAAHAAVGDAIGAPKASGHEFPELAQGYLGLVLHPGALAGSAFFLRYAYESDRHSFEPVPRNVQDHVASLGASYDALSAKPGMLRVSPAFGVDLQSEAADATLARAVSVPVYYGLLRADLRLMPDLLLAADYRMQMLPSAKALVHYVTLEADYLVTSYARLGVFGGLKQSGANDPMSPNEQQVLGRIQLFY